jgi:hypothetical protein
LPSTPTQFLSALFEYNSNSAVSMAVAKVRTSLTVNFVPLHLGYDSITRNEYVRDHVTEFANHLYNPDPDNPVAIAYVDGTYAKIPKSRNFKVLRQSFCVHKGYHLVKPALVVAPDGFILDVHGPYFSDSRNNDARMLVDQYNVDVEGIRRWFMEGDIFIVDRGYRDAIPFLENLGIHHRMPSLLPPRQAQHTVEEANASRLVTKTRWIVEARNGHIKSIFKFFRDTIHIHHVPNLRDFFRIACAIINRFHPTIRMQGANAQLAREMLDRAKEPNIVMARVDQFNLRNRNAEWIHLNEEHLPGFPRLTLDYLRDITCGTYQVKLAPSYVQDKIAREANEHFEYDELIDEPGFLRVRVFSRHKNATKYQLWIAYNNAMFNRLVGEENDMADENPILGYYCTCKAGARTLGTCAHVASVLWFLGYARHEPNVRYPWTKVLETVSDAAHRHRNDEDEELPIIV